MKYLLHPVTFYGGKVNLWMSTGGLRDAEGRTPADAASSLKMHFRQSHAPIHSDERINAERVLGLAVDEFSHFYAVEEESRDEWDEFVKSATAPGASLSPSEKRSLATWIQEEQDAREAK